MGPNCTTGHSSVIFTSLSTFCCFLVIGILILPGFLHSECQVTMLLKVLGPVLKRLPKVAPSLDPAPYVEVKLEEEIRFFEKLRAAMKERVWERKGSSASPLSPCALSRSTGADIITHILVMVRG